jgi:hypothetical protein
LNSDEAGIDTVFGALVLILVCTMTSAILFSFPVSGPQEWRKNGDIENQFDCILYSTIDISFSGSGDAGRKSLTVASYLIETPTDASPLQSNGLEEGARDEISDVVDFYMSRCAGWLLQISWENNCTKEVASRNQAAVGGSDTYVLERTVPDPDHGSRRIRLLLAD